MHADYLDAVRAAVLDFYGSAENVPADTACAIMVRGGTAYDGQQLGAELHHLGKKPGGEKIAAAHEVFANNYFKRHPILPDDSL